METKFLDYMVALAKDVGTIKKINMYNEDAIYITGKTEGGRDFSLNLLIEEVKEDA